MIDFGINKGDFATRFLSDYPCRCFAVEANPSLARSTAERLGIPVEHLAITGKAGEVDIHIGSNCESSSIPANLAKPLTGERVRVASLTYASWVKRHRIDSISLLKVDIEGAELDLLEAWDDAGPQPDQIAVEFHDFADPGQVPRINRCIERLRSAGYAVLNPTAPFRTDCLFVKQSLVRGLRGLLLSTGWRVLGLFHEVRSWRRRRILRKAGGRDVVQDVCEGSTECAE